MILGNISNLINIVFLIVYLVFASEPQVLPNSFIPWPWFLYLGYMGLHHYFDGHQNTTRNLARIYLLRNGLNDNDSKLIFKIQNYLAPGVGSIHSVLVFAFLVLHVSSFIALMVYQGWAVALLAHAIMFLPFTMLLPIFYHQHLKALERRMSKEFQNNPFSMINSEPLSGLSPRDLWELLNEGVDERKDPQQWWAETKFGDCAD